MTSALKQSMDALETIAFVLPGPWGPIASAALHILGGQLDPDQPDPNKPVLDAIKNGFANLDSAMAQNAINKGSKTIGKVKDWIKTTEAMDDLDTNPTSVQSVIDDIGDFDKPFTNYNQIEVEVDLAIDKSAKNYLDLKKAQISSLIGLRMCCACVLNYRVLLQQKLVTMHQESDEQEDRAKVLDDMRYLETYYARLKAYIETEITDPSVLKEFESQCDEMKQTLTSRIGPVQRDGSDPYVFNPSARVSYYYVDTADPNTKLDQTDNTYDYHPARTTFTGKFVSVAPAFWTLAQDMRAHVEQLRRDRLARLAKECDDFKAESTNVLATAQSIMADTKADPAPPSKKPEVDYDNDTDWNNAWQFTGKYVRYAVLFQGSTRNTLASPHSDWHHCTEGSSCCPSVSLPADSSGLAIARIVHRDVADDPSSKAAVTYVVPVPNMTDDSLVDLCPVDDGDVCPNAPISPILMYCNYNADEPKRTWPDPYRVRYRYSYQRTIGGKVCRSLSPSPWFVQTRNGGNDFDADSYFYSKAYYSAQLLVPHIEGCDFVLERQFKGEDPKVIKSRTAAAAQAGMIFLEDDEGP